MKKQNKNSKILRERAEKVLGKKKMSQLDQLSEVDILQLVHELQVHEIELELQNEELVRANTLAQQSSDRYTELYDFSPTGYFTLLNSSLIEEMNLSGAELFNETRSIIQGQLFEKFLALKSREVFRQFIQKIDQSKTKQICEVDIDYLNIKRTIYLTGVLDENQKKYFISVTDITEIKALEQKLKDALEKAKASDQLKTSFLQNLKHEIRTPTNVIVGFSTQLMESDLSEKNRKECGSIIFNSANQLLAIINDVIAASLHETKQEKINESKFLVNDLLYNLLAIFKSQAQSKNLSLKFTTPQPEKNLYVVTDKSKVSQVITNLLTNALKFTQKGEIEFGYTLEKTGITFYVKDTGIGIGQAMQEKIFERFRQANENIERAYGGTGLGLAISKAHVELLGGKIWVKSSLDRGAAFYFSIPTKIISENYKSSTKGISGIPTILLVDDLNLNIKYFKLIISKELNCITFYARNGEEAIQMVKKHPEINFVLMDINMPVMSGIEAAIKIKQFRPDMYIMAQTSYDLATEGDKRLAVAFNDYMSKPIKSAFLKEKFKTLFHY